MCSTGVGWGCGVRRTACGRFGGFLVLAKGARRGICGLRRRAVCSRARQNITQNDRTQSAMDTDVAVIGAGVSGCITALCLRRIGLDVVVIDRASAVALGASLVAGRLHYGGMYFKEFVREGHTRSGTDCILAAAAFHTMLRGDIWAEDAGTSYIVSNDSTEGDEDLMVAFHQSLEESRAALAQRYSPFDLPKLPSRRLNEPERERYRRISGGVRTTEPGVSTAKLAVGLRDLLIEEGASLLLSHDVNRVERLRAPTHFAIACKGPTGASVVRSRAVVQCAGIFGPQLDAMLGVHTPCTITLKGATLLQLTAPAIAVPSTYLVAGGSFNYHRRGPSTLPSNGMLVVGGDDAKEVASVRLPLAESFEVPSAWFNWLDDRAGRDEWQGRARQSVSRASEFIPSLEALEPIAFVARGVVSHDRARHSRTHVNVYHESDGYLATACVKLSSAPLLALDVARRIGAFLGAGREYMKQFEPAWQATKPALVPSAFCFLLSPNQADALSFAEKHGLTRELVPGLRAMTDWPPWTTV